MANNYKNNNSSGQQERQNKAELPSNVVRQYNAELPSQIAYSLVSQFNRLSAERKQN